ncbi:MAG: peptide-methionine (S)-S-oxide reductase MsrA [Planctomycetota bacterium]
MSNCRPRVSRSHRSSPGAWLALPLLAFFPLITATQVNAEESTNSTTETKIATFAGGCFWCTEAVFERMNGVGDVVSGYIGGHVPNPTYEQVCGKQTGHAEAVEIPYDPSVVSYEELLEVFFKTHDPTTLNRQGYDEGPQYRSEIFYHESYQKDAAEKIIKAMDAKGIFNAPIVTKVSEASRFYEAEDYHQDYFANNPGQGYCRAVVAAKVQKFDELFSDKAKP